MTKAKRKQLPKDFQARLERGDLDELKSLFDTHDVNARGGYSKQTALAFVECPDELARWLVEHGADLAALDNYDDTPLHTRSRAWKGRIAVLLELGADVNHGEGTRGTPLHAAAGSYITPNAELLLQHGAHVDALNRDGLTPLAYSLQRCSNMHIERMAALAELLIAAGARQTPEMKTLVDRIGANFEFHRSGFNPEFLGATSAALDKLYDIFGVAPAPRRVLHDGKSPIVAESVHWEERHDELWKLLVPSSGAAATTQGEIVRISGRIHHEIEGNGGGNWDREYEKMAIAYLVHIASGVPLAEPLLMEARAIIAELNKKNADTSRLCELAVKWVALNPVPVKLPSPDYSR